ncbi:hypothetical protein J6590_036759 [Homalodisca vitripennis]|nr:hypothetical protein J6590_036759 [Homalodisca vitripennis]
MESSFDLTFKRSSLKRYSNSARVDGRGQRSCPQDTKTQDRWSYGYGIITMSVIRSILCNGRWMPITLPAVWRRAPSTSR